MQVLEALWQRQMRHVASMCAQQLSVPPGVPESAKYSPCFMLGPSICMQNNEPLV